MLISRIEPVQQPPLLKPRQRVPKTQGLGHKPQWTSVSALETCLRRVASSIAQHTPIFAVDALCAALNALPPTGVRRPEVTPLLHRALGLHTLAVRPALQNLDGSADFQREKTKLNINVRRMHEIECGLVDLLTRLLESADAWSAADRDAKRGIIPQFPSVRFSHSYTSSYHGLDGVTIPSDPTRRVRGSQHAVRESSPRIPRSRHTFYVSMKVWNFVSYILFPGTIFTGTSIQNIITDTSILIL